MFFIPLLASLATWQQASPLPFYPPAEEPFGYDLRLAPGEELLYYSWDQGRPVPFLDRDRSLRVPFGERGLSGRTRVYLPSNSAAEVVTTGAVTLQSVGLMTRPDVLGDALGFTPTSFLRLSLPPQDPTLSGWTVGFWVRPESAGFGRTLALLPGSLELLLQADGRTRARLLPSGEQVLNPGALVAGQRTYVLASYDPLFTRQLRLVVGDVAARATLAANAPPRVASELWLGDLAGNGSGFAGSLDELVVKALPASTNEALRTVRAEPTAGIHRLELVTTGGRRDAITAARPTRRSVLDTPEAFAEGQLGSVVIENGSLRWAPGRWKEIATDGAPAPRTTHPTVSLGDRRVFTFGGETRDTHLGGMFNTDDTWIYDGASERWTPVPTAVAPSPRCHVPAAYSPDHDLVLLVGGWKNDVSPTVNYGDTWVYHVGQRRWEQRFPSGDPAPVGSDFSLVYLPAQQRFLLLLGSRSWLYDPIANHWQIQPTATAVTASGQPTSFSVAGSSMHAVDPGTGRVLLFGGHYPPNATVFSDNTVWYDVVLNRFTLLDPPQRPSPRVRSGFAYDSHRGVFVLFGGVQDQFSQRHDDLWIFDPRTELWSEVACSGRPSVRGGFFGMAFDDVADQFVLFGGRSTPELWLDDTQVLELRPRRAGHAVYTFDRERALGFGRWSAAVTQPADSLVRFLFRGSPDGTDWGRWGASPVRRDGMRYVQVVAFLKPGSHGEVPSIQRMGFE